MDTSTKRVERVIGIETPKVVSARALGAAVEKIVESGAVLEIAVRRGAIDVRCHVRAGDESYRIVALEGEPLSAEAEARWSAFEQKMRADVAAALGA